MARSRNSNAANDDGSCRVLVVHCQPDFAEHMARSIRFSGHEATIASTYADAVDFAKTLHPHVVIADVGESVANGLVLAEALRGALPGSLLMGVVDSANSAERRSLSNAGINRILLKPLDMIGVLSLIERWNSSGRCLDSMGECDS